MNIEEALVGVVRERLRLVAKDVEAEIIASFSLRVAEEVGKIIKCLEITTQRSAQLDTCSINIRIPK